MGRGHEIVRALDLAAQRGSGVPVFAEPVHFVAHGLRRAWPELATPEAWLDPRDVPPARWGPGENIWVVSTYLKLRRFGLDVTISDRLVPGAVNVCYLDAVLQTPDSHRAFVVVAQGDRRPMAGNPKARAELDQIYSARAPLYARADVTVDTARLDVDGVVERLHQSLA